MFSPLCSVVRESTRHSGKRTHKIDRITPHCWVGQVKVENGLAAFQQGMVSSNYIIGNDGRIGGCVSEDNRSWCSSSNANDQRAITIECASDVAAPQTFNDCVYRSLVELCVDICKRYNKDTLVWIDDKAKALAYEPKDNEMLITVHRWFANKACPGNWLMSKMAMFADEVTGRLRNTYKGEETVMVEVKRLTYGAKGEAVKAVQALLKQNGYKGANGKVLTIDGDFGNNTLAAVNAFQKTFCNPDGIVGAKTWTKLLNG